MAFQLLPVTASAFLAIRELIGHLAESGNVAAIFIELLLRVADGDLALLASLALDPE